MPHLRSDRSQKEAMKRSPKPQLGGIRPGIRAVFEDGIAPGVQEAFARPGRRPRAGSAATHSFHVRLTEDEYEAIRAVLHKGETIPDFLRRSGLALVKRRTPTKKA